MNLVPNPGKIVQGEILYEGQNLLKKSDLELQDIRWKEISIIFQGAMNALNPVQRVGNQILEAILAHENITKKNAMNKVEELLKLVHMDISRVNDYPHELSGGMKQRIMIAMAIACNPRLIIADEPSTALDVIVQAQILNLMKSLQKKMNTSMILITHDLSVISELADRCVIMYAGHIIEHAKMNTLLENPMHPYTQALIDSFPSIDRSNIKLQSITGSPPNLLNPPTGCSFHPRCNYSSDRCPKLLPKLMKIDINHYVACHHAF